MGSPGKQTRPTPSNVWAVDLRTIAAAAVLILTSERRHFAGLGGGNEKIFQDFQSL